MATPCDYHRCTSKVPNSTEAIHIDIPALGHKAFCSITCTWSWLQDYVDEQAASVRAVPDPMRRLPPKPAKQPTPQAHATPKPPVRVTSSIPVTKPIKTYKPGEYPWDLMPDQNVKSQIAAMLNKQIDGPYRFVWHALVPYVRIGPADGQQPITVNAGGGLHLKGVPSRTLQGLEQTMDFAIFFEGDGVELRDVISMPGKQLLAKRALDALDKPPALT